MYEFSSWRELQKSRWWSAYLRPLLLAYRILQKLELAQLKDILD